MKKITIAFLLLFIPLISFGATFTPTTISSDNTILTTDIASPYTWFLYYDTSVTGSAETLFGGSINAVPSGSTWGMFAMPLEKQGVWTALLVDYDTNSVYADTICDNYITCKLDPIYRGVEVTFNVNTIPVTGSPIFTKINTSQLVAQVGTAVDSVYSPMWAYFMVSIGVFITFYIAQKIILLVSNRFYNKNSDK